MKKGPPWGGRRSFFRSGSPKTARNFMEECRGLSDQEMGLPSPYRATACIKSCQIPLIHAEVYMSMQALSMIIIVNFMRKKHTGCDLLADTLPWCGHIPYKPYPTTRWHKSSSLGGSIVYLATRQLTLPRATNAGTESALLSAPHSGSRTAP